MRFIPTSAARVEQLKKQAKKLQRNGGGKHTDLLNRVARSAGYEHWHHLTICLEQSEMANSASVLIKECAAIVLAERNGITKVVMTGPEATKSCPLVLFSTGLGDAWLLEPDENLAACLMWQGVEQASSVNSLPTHLEIAWDGTYELAGDFFHIDSRHPEIGIRAIGGYELDGLRQVMHKAQSFERRMDDVILQTDSIELTAEIIRELVRSGWDQGDIEEAARDGARYSPSRNSLLFPPMVG